MIVHLIFEQCSYTVIATLWLVEILIFRQRAVSVFPLLSTC